jgi:hypothetical protein
LKRKAEAAADMPKNKDENDAAAAPDTEAMKRENEDEMQRKISLAHAAEATRLAELNR